MSSVQNNSYGGYNPYQRLQQYQPGELAYDARLASHEEQADGSQEQYGPQGTIFWQILENGQNNGQDSVFLNTDQRKQWFVNAFMKSIGSNGQLNGNFMRESIADSYLQGTGTDILPELNSQPSLSAATDHATVYKTFADPSQGANYLGNLKQQSGWSANQIAADALWGHDQLENTQITNSGTRSLLNTALNDPTDMIDYPVVHLTNGMTQFAQNIYNSNNPAQEINNAFLNSQAKSFNLPIWGNQTNRNGNYYQVPFQQTYGL